MEERGDSSSLFFQGDESYGGKDSRVGLGGLLSIGKIQLAVGEVGLLEFLI